MHQDPNPATNAGLLNVTVRISNTWYTIWQKKKKHGDRSREKDVMTTASLLLQKIFSTNSTASKGKTAQGRT
jgi:hypothetical protein